jgi:V/A-type H+-transporting ATPase subunit C
VKEALEEKDVNGTASKLMKLKRYGDEIEAAMDAYKKTGNMTEANAVIDKVFYGNLSHTIDALNKISPEAAQLVRIDIEMRNILTLLRAKKYNMDPKKIAELLINNGITPQDQLMKIFDSSKDVKEIIGKVKSFDLKKALERYDSEKEKYMLLFEIGMRNYIFKRALKVLRHAVLSFGVLIGYFYLKEMEVFTLRILIMGRMHGLTSEDIASMIEWQI